MNEDFLAMMQQFLKQNGPSLMQQFGQGMGDKQKNLRATGAAGGDMVQVTFNGLLEMVAIKIDPIVVDKRDVETLEQLIMTAANAAYVKVKEKMLQGGE